MFAIKMPKINYINEALSEAYYAPGSVIVEDYLLGPTIPGKWGASSRGTGATITWSLVEGGVQVIGNRISQSLSSFLLSGFEAEIRRAFLSWSSVANLKFVEVSDPGVSFNAVSAVSVDIRIAGSAIDELNNVLAQAALPPLNSGAAAGDIVLDSAENWQINSLNNQPSSVDLFQVIAHEIGHSLGLSHEANMPGSLMNPFYTEDFSGPQPDDVAGVRALYGSGVYRSDFNADGATDILLRNSVTGSNLIRTMNGTSPLSTVPFGRDVADPNWKFQVVGDFNADGRADVILRRYAGAGQSLAWSMNGAVILSESEFGRPVFDTSWEIVGSGDFNNDGKDDVILKNYLSDQNLIWYMNGYQIQNEGLYGRALSDTTWRISATGDFNGDGQTDIVLRHQAPNGGGQNIVWFMNGSNIIGEASIGRAVADVNWEISGAGDFNRDGKTDIFLRNYSNGSNLIWTMNGISILGEFTTPGIPDTNWKATT